MTPTIRPLVSAIAMSLLLSAGAAAAQSGQSETDPARLDEIQVTARGVAESLQDTPLPITAISSKTIEKKGMTDVQDVAALSPSFSFRSPYGRTFDRPVIRGMSNIQGEANASFFIDGIFVQGDISGYGLENLERVEVIRGPQSAAFGRRTFSGAVDFITRRPGSLDGTRLTLGVGNHGQERMGIFHSGGSGDGTFGYDVSYQKRGNDALFFNDASGRKDLGERESNSGMVALGWSPTESMEITARVMQQKNRDSHAAIARLGSDNLNCFLPQYTGDLYFGVYPILANRQRGYYCGALPTPERFGINTDEYIAAGYMPGIKSDFLRSSLRVDYLFENNWQFTSTTAYNDTETYNGFDQDYSAERGFGGAFETYGQSGVKDWSQDFRLSTDQELPVSGLMGVYYYNQKAQPGWGGDLTGFMLPGNMSVTPIARDPNDKTVNKAIYALVSWQINDQWTTSLEARYARDEISKGAVDTRALGAAIYRQEYSLSKTFTSFTPRWTLSYQVADNVNLYTLVSKGTKPGGFNTDVYRADFQESERDRLISMGYDSFDEEKAWNYEIGVKSDLADGALRLNANIYQIDWDNQQLTATGPVTRRDGSLFATSYTDNVGKSRIRGFELESQWLFSPGWVATLAYSYTDAKILTFLSQDQADLFATIPNPDLTDPSADAGGAYLPRVPKQKVSLGLMYDGTFSNGWGYGFNMDTTYEGRRYVQVHNLAWLDPSTRTNLRFSLRPNEQLQFSAYVNNAFNDRTPEDAQRTVDSGATFVAWPAVPPLSGLALTNLRDFGISPSMPRMYGVEMTYRF